MALYKDDKVLYKRVRNYALGKQDLSGYKKQLDIPSNNSFIKIDWRIKKRIRRKIINKLVRKVIRFYKVKKMVKRLKNGFNK